MKKYKTPKAVLRHVRESLQNPANFCRNQLSRPGGPKSDDGVARCTLGWVGYYSADYDANIAARDLLRPALGNNQTIPGVNDCKGRKAILAGIDKALAS